MKVLLADDDESILRMLRALVASWGYEPVLASDGLRALSVLGGPEPPPVAILDWMMPGVAGIDVVRTLEREGKPKRPRVLLLTARGGSADLAQALAAGADDYVTKPFDPLVLKARLEATMRRAQVGSGGAIAPGTVLDGRYRLEERIGAGGMGAVFRATHLGLKTTVAVKIVRTDRPDVPQVQARFEREARVAASITSPHVARVLDCGTTTSGHSYLVMEHLKGRTLEERIEREGPLTVGEAVEVITAIADGLEAAHRAGLVHRDVKPGNVFLTTDEQGRPTAKLIDFGLAKDIVAEGAPTLTGHGEVMGTVGFMSPAQLLGEPATPDCDLWALAATAVAALVGHSPFEAEIQSLTILNTLQGEVPQLSLLRAGLPRELDAWAETAFAREQAQRFVTASELAYAFAVAARCREGFSPREARPTP